MATHMLNYVFFAILLLLNVNIPAGDARGLAGVNPLCRTATHKRLCNRMVNGATNLQEASINAVKAALDVGRRVQARVSLIQPVLSTMDTMSQDSIMGTCVEGFDRIVEDLQTSLEALESNDKGTVVTRLSAALSNDCDDALAEFHVNSPLGKYTKLLYKQVDNCLAVIMQS